MTTVVRSVEVITRVVDGILVVGALVVGVLVDGDLVVGVLVVGALVVGTLVVVVSEERERIMAELLSTSLLFPGMFKRKSLRSFYALS